MFASALLLIPTILIYISNRKWPQLRDIILKIV